MPGTAKFFRRTAILTLALWSTGTATAFAFSDTQTHWANACINQLSQRRLISGYPDGRFRPNNTVNRAEFAVLMLNVFPNAPRSRPATSFRDVPTSYWAYRAIRDASERAFFSGYPDGTFLPTQAIPRVQAIAIVANALNQESPATPDATLRQYFDDAAQVPNYAKRGVAAATLNNLVVNYPNLRQLRPNQAATRGEVAAFLCQALKLDQAVPAQYVVGPRFTWAVPPAVNGFPPFSQGLTVTRSGAKYGYVDTTGKVVIPARFDAALPFKEDLAAAQVIPDANGGRWGFIDRQGNWVIQPQFASVQSFSEGLAAVVLDGKTGFIDRTGRWVIQPEYEEAQSFSQGLAAVRLNQQWGFIDKTGKRVIQPQPYQEVSAFSEGLARIRSNGQEGFIDQTGKVVIAPQYGSVQSFAGGLAAVQNSESRWGYIDKTGKVVIQPQYRSVQSFSEGLAGVLIGDKWGFINSQGAIAIPAQFYPPRGQSPSGVVVEPLNPEAVQPFSQGVAAVKLGDKAGFINKNGTFVVAAQFAETQSFSEGLARVNLGGRWEAVPLSFAPDGSEPPMEMVLQGGEWGYIRLP